MSSMFEPKTKEDFLKEVDHSLDQAKNGQRLDAVQAVKDMSKELKAGYIAMNAMHAEKTKRSAYAEAQTAYLTGESDTVNGVTVHKTSGAIDYIDVANVVSKGVQAGWSGTTDDLVIKTQVESGCSALENTPNTYTIRFTYDGNGAIAGVAPN